MRVMKQKQCQLLTKFRGIPSNSDPGRVRRRRAVEYKELEPTRRADVSIRRRSDCTRVPGATKLWEDRASTHTVPMCTRNSWEESCY